jgi:hypothetical protein
MVDIFGQIYRGRLSGKLQLDEKLIEQFVLDNFQMRAPCGDWNGNALNLSMTQN